MRPRCCVRLFVSIKHGLQYSHVRCRCRGKYHARRRGYELVCGGQQLVANHARKSRTISHRTTDRTMSSRATWPYSSSAAVLGCWPSEYFNLCEQLLASPVVPTVDYGNVVSSTATVACSVLITSDDRVATFRASGIHLLYIESSYTACGRLMR